MSQYDESPNSGDTSGLLSVREILSILFLRKWAILCVFLGVVAVAAFLTFYFITPSYKASATIIVNTSDLVVPMVDAPPVSDFEKLIAFNTQKDIIKSPTIVAPVVDQLDLANKRVLSNYEKLKLWAKGIRRILGKKLGIKRWQRLPDPRAASIAAVIADLDTVTKPDSKAIELTYRAHQPKEAAATLNAVLDKYQKYFYDLITQRAKGITDYLQAELDHVQSRLDTTENSLLDFRKKDRLILSEAPAPRIHSRVTDADERFKMLEGATKSFTGITDSVEVQNELKLSVLADQQKLNQLKTQYAPSDPAVVALRKEIDLYLNALKAIPERELELAKLKRNLQVNQELYLFLQKNLEKAKMVEAGNAGKMDIINVMAKAQPDDSPVSPKQWMIMGLAVVFGALLGMVYAFVLTYMDHTIRTTRDVRVHLGMRTLGSLRKL